MKKGKSLCSLLTVATLAFTAFPVSAAEIQENGVVEQLEEENLTSASVTVQGIYVPTLDNNGIVAGLCTDISGNGEQEYRWIAYNIKEEKWLEVGGWTSESNWVTYKPEKYGDYLLQGQVRLKDNPDNVQVSTIGFTYHPNISGKCQMPYTGPGGGYLIGVESYNNPNQEYQYELLVLDCTLLAQGKDAWIYTTGKCNVPEKSFWTVWQPKYGYYWTLFRVFDKNGNLIDEDCYGFENTSYNGQGNTGNGTDQPTQPEHTHSYTATVTKQPTCTENGIRTYTCSCGSSYTEEIAATGHKWDNGKVTTQPTCTRDGVKTYTCQNCGQTRTESVSATGQHTWDNGKVTKAATCETDGVKTYTCTKCGQTRTETIAATGHNWDSGKVTKTATCETDGVKTYTCTKCGKTKTESIKATGHNWDSGTVTKQPTCTANGVKTYKCQNCGQTKTESIPATGHTWDAGTITTPATCEADGVKTYTCTKCGETKTESIPATGHTWDAGTITTPATCEADGVKTYTCTKCSQTRTETISATGHTAGDWEITKPASTAAAQTLDDFGARVKKCTTCGTVLSEETIITIDMGNGETQQICGVFDDQKAQELFEQTNELRRSLGLNELQWFNKLDATAKIRAAEIDITGSHIKPNGEKPYYDTGMDKIYLGENLGFGAETSTEAMESWKNSPSHYANLTNANYTKFNAACFKPDDLEYCIWLQDFM